MFGPFAGVSGEVTLTFPADTTYRTALVAGLMLTAALIAFLLVGPRRVDDAATPVRPWRGLVAGSLGLAGAAWVIGGLAGLGLVAALAAALVGVRSRFGPVVGGRSAVVVAGVGFTLAGAMLSTGPWRAADGYVGHSAVIQGAAVLAVAAPAVSVLLATAAESSSLAGRTARLRRSRSRTNTRTGSSIKA